MTVTGSAPETDSLEIAQVVQTIKTIDLAEDDAEDVVDDVDEGDVILDLRREYVAPVAHGPLAAIAVAPGGGLEMRPGSRTPVWRCFHLTSWVEEL